MKKFHNFLSIGIFPATNLLKIIFWLNVRIICNSLTSFWYYWVPTFRSACPNYTPDFGLSLSTLFLSILQIEWNRNVWCINSLSYRAPFLMNRVRWIAFKSFEKKYMCSLDQLLTIKLIVSIVELLTSNQITIDKQLKSLKLITKNLAHLQKFLFQHFTWERYFTNS